MSLNWKITKHKQKPSKCYLTTLFNKTFIIKKCTKCTLFVCKLLLNLIISFFEFAF